MKKWRNYLTGAIATFLFCLYTTLVSAACYKDLNPCDWRIHGHWVECEVDLIYWKPCIDNLDLAAIVTEDNGKNTVKYKDLCSDWQSGVRVAFLVPDVFYGWDFSTSYYRVCYENSTKQTYHNRDANNGIISPLLIDAFADTWEEGEQELDLFYSEWDLLLTYDVYNGPCHRFTPYFGIAGMFLNQEIDGEFARRTLFPIGMQPKQNEETDTIVETEWKSDYSGVGIRMGAMYECNIADCIFFTNANLTLLEGDAKTTNEQILMVPQQKNVTVKITDDDGCHIVNGYHIQTGIKFSSSICGCDYGIRLGYEFVNWHNLPNQRVFNGENINTESGHSTSPRTRSLGFHGLFAGLSANF